MSDEKHELRIAKITSTTLGWEDHGIFTCILQLDYGDSGQGAGMYALDEYDPAVRVRRGTAQGLDFIMRVIKACGVERWEDIVGRTVHVWADHSKVYGMAPLPTEPGTPFMFDDSWVQPRSKSTVSA